MLGATRRRVPVGPLILAGVLVIACSSRSGGASGTPTARQRLDAAAARLQAVNAFHFVLSHQNGASTIAEGLQMTRAEGDFERPDRYSARVNATFQGFPVSVKVVNVGDKTWITNPLQGADQFQLLPNGPQTASILDPETGLLKAAHDMSDPTVTGTQRIGDVATFMLQGRVDAGTLRSLATDAEAGRSVPVRVWIGKDDSLVYRVRLDGPLSAAEAKNIVRQVDLSNFDEPVDIEPPVAAP